MFSDYFLISNLGISLSEGFGKLANLKDLNLKWCKNLTSLPDSKFIF